MLQIIEMVKVGYFFSEGFNIKKIGRLPNVKMNVTLAKRGAKGTIEVLNNLKLNKEYYLATGEHAAIVRKTKKDLEYLELQEEIGKGSGWTSFNRYGSVLKTLDKRFNCTNSIRKESGIILEYSIILMEVDSFKNNLDFQEILGYINTATNKQVKGVQGGKK